MGSSIWEIFTAGGWVMAPLLAFSLISWAIIFERAFVYLTLKPKLESVSDSLRNSLRVGDLETAKQICVSQKPHISEVFESALDTKRSREDVERVTERNRLRLMAHYKKYLWILGTIGSASPFVGLLGTVVGIVKAFGEMAEQGAGGFSVVSAGISEALVATATGLVVAIIALLTYNIFINAANQTLSSLKLTLDELMDQARATNA